MPGSAARARRVAGLGALALAAAALGGCVRTPDTAFFEGFDVVGGSEQAPLMRERLLRAFPLGTQGDAQLIAYLKSQGFEVGRWDVPANPQNPAYGQARYAHRGAFVTLFETGVYWRLDPQGRLSELDVNHEPAL